MVALGPGQAEQPLLEDRVGAVPEREREAQPAAGRRRCRAGRPRPSGRRASGRGRAGSSPRRRRRPSSPRARCPTGARRGTAPSATTGPLARAGRPGADARHWARAWNWQVLPAGSRVVLAQQTLAVADLDDADDKNPIPGGSNRRCRNRRRHPPPLGRRGREHIGRVGHHERGQQIPGKCAASSVPDATTNPKVGYSPGNG